MIKPYTALAVQSGWPRIYKKEDIKDVAIPHVKRLIEFAMPAANWEAPVKLIAIPEGALTGWWAEFVFDHITFAREMAVESVPGEETELLGEIAKKYNCYLMGCVKSRDDELIKDRYFNIAFLIDPKGEVILKHYKLQLIAESRSTTPHDVWDAFTSKYGDGLDAFFQVVDTEIGRIGLTICMEGSYPEIYRAYAMQGAEIIYRPSYVEPWCSGPGVSWWEIQNRARALDNNFYVICPGDGPRYHNVETAVNFSGGNSMIVDYKGQVLSGCDSTIEGYCNAVLNIEALRNHREMALFGNWLPTLRTEYFNKLYDKPIFPKNKWMEKTTGTRDEYLTMLRGTIKKFQDEGIYLVPSA